MRLDVFEFLFLLELIGTFIFGERAIDRVFGQLAVIIHINLSTPASIPRCLFLQSHCCRGLCPNGCVAAIP